MISCKAHSHFNGLTITHILDSTLLIDVDVEAVGLVVHGAHGVGLEDAVFLGEILFSEGLSFPTVSMQDLCRSFYVSRYGWCCCRGRESKGTYDFIMALANLLPHQLVRPLIDLLSTLALDSGNYERHVVCRFDREGSPENGSL